MSYQYPFIPGHSSMSATPPTSYRWDDNDPHHHQQQQHQQHLDQQILQHPLQHQPEQTEDVYSATTPTSLQPQERVPIVPSQKPRRPGSSHVLEGDELQLVSVPALLKPEHMRPPMIDTTRAYRVGASASPPSGPPSAGPSSASFGGIGPVRTHISPVHANPRVSTHPYRRPQSAAGVVIAKSRREPEDVQSVRQVSSSTSMVPGPPSLTTAVTRMPVPSSVAKMVSTSKGLINPAYSATGNNNFMIRTDLHFNSETSILTALCELPGRSKSDVTVVLSTNPVNRVKQIVVTARAPEDIADGGCVLRERKSGSVSRTFVVPSETTFNDITAELQNGLLSLKIQCPPSSAEDDSQEIVIR